MAGFRFGERGRGVLPDTLSTAREANDGLVQSLATMSRRLWRRRYVRTGLEDVLQGLPEELLTEQYRLWKQRSVGVEFTVILLGEMIGFMRGFGGFAYAWLIVIFVLFLLFESPNTATEWLIDAYQICKEGRRSEHVIVALIKHVASVPTYVINLVGLGGWIYFMIWPHAHLVSG